jgi:hypothetical protein
MTSAKNPDGSVDYFAQHKSKPAPNIIHHPPATMKPKKLAKGSKQNYSSQQQQTQERE